MRRYCWCRTLFAILLCLLIVYPVAAENKATVLNKDYLFKDVPFSTVESNPKLDALIFNSSGSNIYGQIFVPSAIYKAKRPVVVMFHGFAGFTRWDDVGHALCQTGAVVVVPHHRGAWGSQGEYSITNCIEDAVNVANFVHSEAFSQKYNTDPEEIFLLGHSMGGNTVVNAAVRLAFLKGIILLAPCDISALLKGLNNEQKRAFIVENGIEALRSRGTEFMLRNIAENAATMSFTNKAQILGKSNVFIATGVADMVCPSKICVDPLWELLSARNTHKLHVYKQYRAEHSLMGARIQLVKDLITFINGAK